MNVNDAFETFQRIVNADIKQVRSARSRRDLFKNAFNKEPDVSEVVPSGSLARGTHKDPINDVDVVIIYDEDDHPDWGQDGDSAEDALNYTRKRVNHLLGATHGTHARAVRLAEPRNHAVKCFLDDKDDPDAFTVDAMPAFRRDGALLVPEKQSRGWVATNPEFLIKEVAKRHADWGKYAGTVRMLKWWAAEQDIKVKSLVMEVLALDYLPTNRTQPVALKEFFVSAAYFVQGGGIVEDPAGLCGAIQKDLDYLAFGDRLREAADDAGQAVSAQANSQQARAVTMWGQVFGDAFPKPPKTTTPGVIPPVDPRPVKDTPQG
jgi:hypothetical protein